MPVLVYISCGNDVFCTGANAANAKHIITCCQKLVLRGAMAGESGLLTIRLKNADGITADEQLRDLDPDTSVLEVKQMLQASYPGQPPSASMKIVFAGRSVRLRGRPNPACRGATLLRFRQCSWRDARALRAGGGQGPGVGRISSRRGPAV